jgi:hypothetical protein
MTISICECAVLFPNPVPGRDSTRYRLAIQAIEYSGNYQLIPHLTVSICNKSSQLVVSLESGIAISLFALKPVPEAACSAHSGSLRTQGLRSQQVCRRMAKLLEENRYESNKLDVITERGSAGDSSG